MRLSKSIINSYLYCPMQCKLQFIDRIKVPPSEPLIRGGKVHKALELYYDNINVNNLYENYKKEINRAMFLSEEGQKYKYYITGIYNWEIIRANHCITNKKDFETYFIPKYRELKIRTEYLVGIIDVVHQLFDDRVGVFDYKSGDPLKKVPENLPSYLKEEMIFYHIIFTPEYKEKIGLLGILYTHTKDSLRVVNWTEQLQNRVLDTIDLVRNSIEMEIFPCTDAKYKCISCDYKDACKR